MPLLDDLLEGNASHSIAHAAAGLGGLGSPPAMSLALVTCMDARIRPLDALGLSVGDAHVMRNAGGVVTDDVLRSLVVSQHKLRTRSVVVMQHTGCGQATYDGAAFAEELGTTVGQQLPFELATFDDLDASVRAGVERVRTFPFLVDTTEVLGLVYDIGTGRVRVVS